MAKPMTFVRWAFLLVAAVSLSACADSTVLTGPDAEAAFVEAQSRAGDGGRLIIRDTPARPPPAIFVDGVRIEVAPPTLLRQLRPEDIERIEVHKGCRSYGFLGEEGRNGMILIYTKAHDGPSPELEYDEARAEACREEAGILPRVPSR